METTFYFSRLGLGLAVQSPSHKDYLAIKTIFTYSQMWSGDFQGRVNF